MTFYGTFDEKTPDLPLRVALAMIGTASDPTCLICCSDKPIFSMPWVTPCYKLVMASPNYFCLILRELLMSKRGTLIPLATPGFTEDDSKSALIL